MEETKIWPSPVWSQWFFVRKPFNYIWKKNIIIIIIKRKRRWAEKKNKNLHQNRLIKNNWQKSIRNEGQCVIHLLLRHNYLFFLPSFTSLFMWDNHVAAKPKKNTRYFFRAIIQIKHRLLRENVCQTTMPQRERGEKKRRKTSPGAKGGDPIRSQPTYCKFSIVLPPIR